MPSGTEQQIAFQRLFNRLLAVERDVVMIAAVGQQQTRGLQVAQRLVQPFVVKQLSDAPLRRLVINHLAFPGDPCGIRGTVRAKLRPFLGGVNAQTDGHGNP